MFQYAPPLLSDSMPRCFSESRFPLAFLIVAETIPLAIVAVVASSVIVTGGFGSAACPH